MSINNQPFYLGQKVVALKDSIHEEYFKKGVEYLVQDVKYHCCKWHVCVGFKVIFLNQQCSDCGHIFSHWGNHAYHSAKHFAPINPYTNSVTKELAEKALSVGDSVDQPVKEIVNYQP